MKTIMDRNDEYSQVLKNNLQLQEKVDDTTQIDQLRAENEQLKAQNERLCKEVLMLDTKLTETQCQYNVPSDKSEEAEP